MDNLIQKTSDVKSLTSVENLINIAMGPPEKNILNYKILQTVLYILARHMRMLQTKVEIRISDDVKEQSEGEKSKGSPSSLLSSASTPSAERETEDGGVKYDQTREREETARATSNERGKAGRAELIGQSRVVKGDVKEKELAKREKGKDIPLIEKGKAEKALEKENTVKEKYLEEKEQELHNMLPKEKEKYLKEQEKEERGLEKMPLRKKEIIKKKQYEQIAMKNMTIEEKEKQEERLLSQKKAHAAGSSIAVTVEQGPTTRFEPWSGVGGIKVVTQSEFRKLEQVVTELKEKALPLPMPTLPDSKKLRSELVKGRASLSDTMEAMQISARVQAAEQAIDRMAGMLTKLAVAGAMPEEFSKQLEEVKAEIVAVQAENSVRQSIRHHKSLAIDPTSETLPHVSMAESTSRISGASRMCISSRFTVTRDQLDHALLLTKEELVKKIATMTHTATATSETACRTASMVAENLDVAMHLNDRIDGLHGLHLERAEQLARVAAGIDTQMKSFEQQIEQTKSDLEGITLLRTVNNNAESAAILELNNRYECLTTDLDEILTAHRRLTELQTRLDGELHSLSEAVEMLREQKADRDEVLDGLRDKANNKRLEGLLTARDLAASRSILELKLAQCYKKFTQQEAVWITALKDLEAAMDTKAEIMQLLVMKDEAQKALQYIHDRLEELAVILGEPKAAILTRLLSKDGHCGLCQESAQMNPHDADYGKPFQLPLSLRPSPEKKPCVPQLLPSIPDDMKIKEHICHRWVGGSHTLVRNGAPRETAAQPMPPAPSHRFTEYGSDGKGLLSNTSLNSELRPVMELTFQLAMPLLSRGLQASSRRFGHYLMVEELLPCIECNETPTKRRSAKYIIPKAYRGGGDNKSSNVRRGCECDCLPIIP